jgi:hypothetical protein
MMTLARQSSPDRAARTLEGIAVNGASAHCQPRRREGTNAA